MFPERDLKISSMEGRLISGSFFTLSFLVAVWLEVGGGVSVLVCMGGCVGLEDGGIGGNPEADGVFGAPGLPAFG
jgi:hypothetical protein